MRFPKPAPPAGRPSIRSAAVRWRGGAPPMAVGGAVDRHFIFPAAFWIIDAHLSTMGRRSPLRSFSGERDGDPLAGPRDRSEERRGGNGCVSNCKSWWSPLHSKKKN